MLQEPVWTVFCLLGAVCLPVVVVRNLYAPIVWALTQTLTVALLVAQAAKMLLGMRFLQTGTRFLISPTFFAQSCFPVF